MKDTNVEQETKTENDNIKGIMSNLEMKAGTVDMKEVKPEQETSVGNVEMTESSSEEKNKGINSVTECKKIDISEVEQNANDNIHAKEITFQENLTDINAKKAIIAEAESEVKCIGDSDIEHRLKEDTVKAETLEKSDSKEQEVKDNGDGTLVMCIKDEENSESNIQAKSLEDTTSKESDLKEIASESKNLADKESVGLLNSETVDKSRTKENMDKKDEDSVSADHKQEKYSMKTENNSVSNRDKENINNKENVVKEIPKEVKEIPKEESTNKHKEEGISKHKEGSGNNQKEGSVNNHKESSVKENSSANKSSDHSTSHRSKHHKHQHRDKSGSKPSSSHESKSNRHEHHRSDSKSDHSHHKKSSSHQKSSGAEASQRSSSSNSQKTSSSTPQKSEPRSKHDHVNKTVSKDSSDKTPHKDTKPITKDSHKSESASKSESSSSDKHRSHHRKKRIVNCGVQVNLRKKTDTKSSQVPEDIGGLSTGKVTESQKLSDKKLQRIAYVQQSMNNVQKGGKHAKPTPRTGLEGLTESKEQYSDQDFSEFSSESQGNKFWKTPVVSIEKYKYKNLMHVEKYSNGGGLILHAYQNEVDKLSDTEKYEFAREFMDFTYGEPSEGVANCCISVVHGAISHMPDLIEHFADTYPNLTVKAGVLGKSDIETMSMEKYREQLNKSFSAGTFRCGPLLQVSVVGTAQEEVGDYFPEVLDMFESDPFLNLVMPWGELSSVRMASRNMSNDGPIMWTRPGEQLIPTADMPKSPFKRKR